MTMCHVATISGRVDCDGPAVPGVHGLFVSQGAYVICSGNGHMVLRSRKMSPPCSAGPERAEKEKRGDLVR